MQSTTESRQAGACKNKIVEKTEAVPYHELQILSAGTQARQSQIRQVLIDLEFAHKRIEELQYTIQIKVIYCNGSCRSSETDLSKRNLQ